MEEDIKIRVFDFMRVGNLFYVHMRFDKNKMPFKARYSYVTIHNITMRLTDDRLDYHSFTGDDWYIIAKPDGARHIDTFCSIGGNIENLRRDWEHAIVMGKLDGTFPHDAPFKGFL